MIPTRQRTTLSPAPNSIPAAALSSAHGQRRARRRPSGVVLIEFAIITFVLLLILLGTVAIGHMIFVAYAVQNSADLLAKELARSPVPGAYTLEQALNDPQVQGRVFDIRQMAIDLTGFPGGTSDDLLIWLEANVFTPGNGYPSGIPLVNRLTLPLLVQDPSNANIIRWPGTTSAPGTAFVSGSTWDVTIVPPSGPVIVRPLVESTVSPDPFPITSPLEGIVALRFNYRYRLGILNTRTNVEPAFDPSADTLIDATDPFERLLEGQAIYRREVVR